MRDWEGVAYSSVVLHAFLHDWCYLELALSLHDCEFQFFDFIRYGQRSAENGRGI